LQAPSGVGCCFMYAVGALVDSAVDRVLLTVVAPAEAVRFEQKLNQGHGIYYY